MSPPSSPSSPDSPPSGTNINNKKPSSGQSRKSAQSLTSLGIGSSISTTQLRRQKQLDIDLIKPRAENYQQSGGDDGSIDDCIMFLIYCSEHDRFAVTDVSNDGTIWLPFIYRDGRNWRKASENGLLSMFEKRDADGTVINQVNMPHTSKMIELGHMQTTTGRWIQRGTQFVTITRCQQTCLPINSIRWMDAGNILKDDVLVWGPEFRNYLENFERRNFELHVNEFSIDLILKYSSQSTMERTDGKGGNTLPDMIKSRNVSQKSLLYLYDHYLRHCFPSCFMNLGSFRIYLHKCGLSPEVVRAEGKYLFRLCLTRPKRDCQGQSYVDFLDICYLLIGLDPELPNERPRQTFLDHLRMVHGNQKKSTSASSSKRGVRSKSARNKKAGGRKAKSVEDGGGTGTPKTKSSSGKSDVANNNNVDDQQQQSLLYNCGLPKSIFLKFTKKQKQKERLVSDKVSRGICRNCRAKNFEYGQHCVMFDSTNRCVEPKIILNAENQFTPISKLEGRKLYSAEYVFKTDSIGNALFDYMRNRKFLLQDENVNADKNEEDYVINAYLTICENVRKLLKHEPKLIKRSGPTVVIGDIRGNLNSLFTLETIFWSTMPVLASNLVFLGNYSGSGSNATFSLETIIYLFSIKYLCPQKVVLLKGVHETRAKNERTLLQQCRRRYGDDNGTKIWRSINMVYDELPFICIINESIVCVSSGISKDSITHRLSTLFEGLLDTQKLSNDSGPSTPSKDFEIFQNILINAPDYKDERQSNLNPCKSRELFKPNPNVPNGSLFSMESFKQFMTLNNFSYMIRGNEPLLDGYHIAFNNRLITIYSNVEVDAKSNAQINVAMVAFIHHPSGRIQLKEIEHASNMNPILPNKNTSEYMCVGK